MANVIFSVNNYKRNWNFVYRQYSLNSHKKTLKKAVVSVINDLVTDQRVARTCNTLKNLGFEVSLIGRKLQHSLPLSEKSYKMIRMRLLFIKGPLFYAEYNLRFFCKLLFTKADLLIANDLDTLLANYIIHKIKRIPIVYDSHEHFTSVPELHGRFAQKVWLLIEKWIFPKLDVIITVNDSIARLYFEEYSKELIVIRNIPENKDIKKVKTRKELKLPEDKNIIVLQGAGLNINRGVEEAISAMKSIENAILIIIGAGDVIHAVQKQVQTESLQEKVFFIPKQNPENLFHYTTNADLGITLDKPSTPCYIYSLPNKLFDYIHAGIPVLASQLPEVAAIVKKYEIGLLIDNHSIEEIASKIKIMLSDKNQIQKWKNNCLIASKELNWDFEGKKLTGIFEKYL